MGRYLWMDGITMGDPDRILGIPVAESEFSPSTFTTGLYVGLLGAFYYYWICDSLELELQVLVEKYAETNQIAYVCRRKVDGMPQIAEAFVAQQAGLSQKEGFVFCVLCFAKHQTPNTKHQTRGL